MPSASCACPALWATAVRCERGVDGLKQGGVIEWFGEEGHRARLQRLGAYGLIPVRRYKDNGHTGLARAQLPLQFQAADAWQLHIEEQTRRRVHLPRLAEGLRGGEATGSPSHRAQETGEGVTNRLIIIDNHDQRGRGHGYLPGLVCVRSRHVPSSGKRTTRCGKAALILWYRLSCLPGGREREFFRHPGQLRDGGGPHLAHDLPAVHLDSDFARPQVRGDLLVEEASDDPLHHVPLAGGERVIPLVQPGQCRPLVPHHAVTLQCLLNGIKE